MRFLGVRRLRPVCWTLAALMAGFVSRAVGAEPAVAWWSESLRPLAFVADGRQQGVAIDLLALASERAGLPRPEPVFVPWARVLLQLSSKQPACAVAMTRTAAREPLYQWAGPFISSYLSVAQRADASALSTQLPLQGLSLVVVRGDAAESAAVELGATEAQITRVSSGAAAVRMVILGRAQAWLHGNNSQQQTVAELGVQARELRIGPLLRQGSIYFACNHEVPPAYLARLHWSVSDLVAASGTAGSDYDRILADYLKELRSPAHHPGSTTR